MNASIRLIGSVALICLAGCTAMVPYRDGLFDENSSCGTESV